MVVIWKEKAEAKVVETVDVDDDDDYDWLRDPVQVDASASASKAEPVGAAAVSSACDRALALAGGLEAEPSAAPRTCGSVPKLDLAASSMANGKPEVMLPMQKTLGLAELASMMASDIAAMEDDSDASSEASAPQGHLPAAPVVPAPTPATDSAPASQEVAAVVKVPVHVSQPVAAPASVASPAEQTAAPSDVLRTGENVESWDRLGEAQQAEDASISDDEPDCDIPPVQVAIRVRPLLGWERVEGHELSALQLGRASQGEISLVQASKEDGDVAHSQSKAKSFSFDKVFGAEATQQDVWDEVKLSSYVSKVVDGFNATVFAYGQTGSGKTYSMEGFAYDKGGGQVAPSLEMKVSRNPYDNVPPEQLGIVPKAIRDLFKRLIKEKTLATGNEPETQPDESVCVRLSYMQIYKERIFDLLNPLSTANASSNFGVGRDGKKEQGKDAGAGLRMRWDGGRGQFFVENLYEYDCTNADEALDHYLNGLRQKKMAATTMNSASSRSHSLLTLTVVRRTKIPGADVTDCSTRTAYSEVVSKLSLVDLAGSERAGAHTQATETGTGEARFKEAVNINQSLLVLRKVITSLAKRDAGKDMRHIPYRESKLTSLLKQSIGGNGHMLMLACLSPSDKYAEENLSTLKYASAASCIKNKPVRNLDPKDQWIQHLQEQLDAAHSYILQSQGLDELPEELQELARRGPVAPTQHRRRRRGQSMQRRAGARIPRSGYSHAAHALAVSLGGPAPPPRGRRPPAPPQHQRHAQQQFQQHWQQSHGSDHNCVGYPEMDDDSREEPSQLYLSLKQRSAAQRSSQALSGRQASSERILAPLQPPVAHSIAQTSSERVLPPLSPPVKESPRPERVLPPLAPPMPADSDRPGSRSRRSMASPTRSPNVSARGELRPLSSGMGMRSASSPSLVKRTSTQLNSDLANEFKNIGLAASPLIQLAMKCEADPVAMKSELETELLAAERKVEELKANLTKVLSNLPKGASGYLNFEHSDVLNACPNVGG